MFHTVSFLSLCKKLKLTSDSNERVKITLFHSILILFPFVLTFSIKMSSFCDGSFILAILIIWPVKT